MKAKIIVDKKKIISKIDDRLYSSFIEHLGRAVYGGIYEPGHDTADDMGFRKDVMDVIKDLNVAAVRYPGGNFVSGYCWEDGIGDKSKRPHKLDLAWKTIETNEVGLDEFQEWAKRANTEIVYAVNLGTRGPKEAGEVVEYANLTTDTYFANLRKSNGFEKPFGIKTWCLGNEMDGDWQIGHKTAVEYARIAHEAAKIMKWVDPSIEVIACGSSFSSIPTFGEWEETVLRECYEDIDYLSLHQYYGNQEDDTPEFLGCSVDLDRFIKKVASICDKVKDEKKTDKQINLSFDEWNVWFHSNEQDKEIERWSIAPHQLEDIYNLEDALLVGCMMNTLINNSDRVKIACLAQLVNVIAPIMTDNGGKVWLQTIFYPFLYGSKYGRGTALKLDIDCESYKAKEYDVPYVDAAAVVSEDDNLSIYLVNRHLEDEMEVEIDLKEFGFTKDNIREFKILNSKDVKDANSTDDPENVVPVDGKMIDIEDGVLKITLEKHSYNFIRLEK